MRHLRGWLRGAGSLRGLGPGGSGGSAVWQRRFLAAAAALYLAALAGGIVVLLLPEPPVEPLIGAAGWGRARGFWPKPPSELEHGLRAAIRLHPRARFWIVDQASPLPSKVIRTRPFEARGPILVPYLLAEPKTGAPATDAMIRLRCVPTGAVLRPTLRPTGISVAELLIEPDAWFCDGPVVMTTSSSGRERLIVGTPFRTSRVERWKRSVLAQVPRHALVLVIILAIGLALSLVVERWCDPARLPLVLMLGPLSAGLLSFFVYWWSPAVGVVLSWIVVSGSLGWCIVTWIRDRQRVLRVMAPLNDALWIWAVVSFFFVVLLLSVDLNAGIWNANSRFWPARWFMDNNVPMLVGEAVFHGSGFDGLLGRWHVSDRPPLQTGVCLLLRPVASCLMGIGIEPRVHYLYDVVGVVLNTAWAYAGFLLCRLLGLSRRSAAAAVVVLALTPFAVLNSCYVWPKMLAGALGLLALLAVLAPMLECRREAASAGLPWVAACAALSLLSHGSTVFFLIALAGWLLVVIRVPRLRHLIAGLVVGLVLIGPWMAWQRLVDPPGTALVKSALAGSEGFGEEDVGVVEAVVRAYREAGLGGWLRSKAQGLEQIVDGKQPPAGIRGPLDTRRWRQLLYIVPSFAPFLLLGLGTLIETDRCRRAGPGRRRTLRACRLLLILAMASLAISWLLQWHTFIIHHNSYAGFVLLVLAATIGGVLTHRRLAIAVLAWSVLQTVAVWIVDPLRDPAVRLDPVGMALLVVLLAAGLLLLLTEAARWWRGEPHALADDAEP